MNKTLKFKRILSTLIIISLLFSIMPGFALAANPGNIKEQLSVIIQGEFGPAARNTYVTGMAQDDDGNTYVVGVTESQFGEKDTSASRKRVFLAKFDENLEMVDYTVLIGEGPEFINYKGYDFAKEEKTYYAGNSSYNSPIAVDEDGNIYIVTQEEASRSLTTSIWDISWDFDDCICEFYCDDEECDMGLTEDCPVCNAFREFEATFVEGKSVDFVLYKFDSYFNKKKEFTIASAQGANPTNSRAVAIEIDDDGSIYVGGGTEVDLGFEDPVYDFNYFDADPTGSGKTMKDTRGFLVKINPTMTKITASTYLGGPLAETQWSSGPNCYVTAIEVDGDYIYVAGNDGGGKIPTVAEDVYEEKTKSDSDVYIVRFNKDDLSVDKAMYYGGEGSDEVTQLTVTGAVYSGMVYIAGRTYSKTLPTHKSAYQPSLNLSTGSYPDAFVARISKDLDIDDDSFAATYIGGTAREDLFGLDVDDDGNVYITGETYGATSYPTTDGTSSGRIFITKFNNDLSDLVASTVVGADPWTGTEQGRAIIVDEEAIIVAGQGDFENTDTARPFVSRFNTSPSHGRVIELEAEPSGTSSNRVYLGLGDVIEIKVKFSSYVLVDTTGGTPRIKLNLGENSYAYYDSGSGTNTLVFKYEIVQGDTTSGNLLNCVDDEIDLNGGTILPRSGGTAEDIKLNLPSDDLSREYIYVNTVPIEVELIRADIGEGAYGLGTQIPLTVRFKDRILTVDTTGGTPYILLNNNGKALFLEKSSARETDLVFVYTVGENETIDELNIASENALVLNGGVIKDYYGIEPDLTLPSPDDEQRTLRGKGIRIVSEAARIVSVTSTLEEGAYTVGQEIPITLNFDKPINKTGTISITLNSKKDYSTISHDEDIENAQSITFNYIVEEGDNTEAYLDYTNEYLIIEEGAQLTAADGTPVSLTMPRPGSENSLSAAKIMIDTEIPTIKYCYKKPNVSVFKAGDEIILEAEFSEEVSIAGNETPYVEVNYTTPGEEDKARFVYIGMDPEDPKTAWFKYTVKENDFLKKERIDFDGWTIEPEGCFVDKAENEANLDLPYNPSPWITPTWQLTFDTVAPHWGEEAELTLTYDEEKGHVKIQWPKAEDDNSGINRYYIYRAVEGKDEKYVDYKSSYSTSHEDKAIVPGTSYIYFVYVEDAAGNMSKALTGKITIPGEKPEEDTMPPYWVSGAKLTGERINSSKAKLSWNPAMAVDLDGEIVRLEIYQKIEGEWGQEPIAVISGEEIDTVMEYTVEGITNDDYEFGIFIVDAADHVSEPLTTVVKKEIADLVVVDINTQTIRKEYLIGDLAEMDIENMRYSGLSFRDGNIYRSWYGATGVTLETILEDLGVFDSYTRMSFQALDMAWPFMLTKEQIEGEQYYFAGSPEDKVPVKPMIALYYSERKDSYLEPPFIEDPSQIPDGFLPGAGPRLFFGQTNYNEPNRSNFVSDVYYIYVDFPEDEKYYVKPTIHNVTEEDLYIEVGQAVPAEEIPARHEVIATDAYGVTIPEDKITREIVLEDEPGKVLSSIDTSKPGVYLVTYTAEDIRGNVAVVTKRVIVYKPIIPKGIYSVNIDESEEYDISKDSQVPTIVSIVDEEKEIEFSADIIPIVHYNEGPLAVLFTHMRGNEMIGLSLIEGQDLTTNTLVNGSFVMKKGDKVMIYVVDKIDGLKGSGTNILFE